jgi:2-oxoglutarate dehydrogenase E2 component (dihydrolipoamide succinyltransferase)
MPINVIMPQLGESVVEGTISKWLKQEGDSIQEFEPLLEVNTDKVDTEIPAPAAGVVLKLLVEEGTVVKAGSPIALIGYPGEAVAEGAASGNGHAQTPAARTTAAGRQRDLGFISPVVAKLADEYHLDLQQVPGTGLGGRITKKDVLAFVEARSGGAATPTPEPARVEPKPATASAPPAVVSTPASSVERAPALSEDSIPVEGMRKLIAEHMVRSKHTAPHVTTVFEADLARVVAHLEKNQETFARDGVKLTLTAYFVSAMCAALKAVPIVNSQWADTQILIKREINIGLAVALDDGLIVPVIKQADSKSLLGLARDINDLARRARAKALKADEVQGGTITLTNHGVSGSLFATPIINQPQTAILGVGAMQKRVVVIGDAIAIRPMAYLTLTFDHRVLDGAIADRFMAAVKQTLEEWN